MKQILTKDEIIELVRLPKNFDTNLIDIDYGFQSKIYPLISPTIIEELKETHPDFYKNIAKAGILYSFVLDIPKIKVHISNFGINQFEQNKTKTAQWWDVRDLGLSWAKKADFYLSQTLLKIAPLFPQMAFLHKAFPWVSFEEMNAFYPLNHSIETYLALCEIMRDAFRHWETQFPNCATTITEDNTLKNYLKHYLLHKTLAKAADSPKLVFLTSGIAIQYEELPWQKSAVVSPEQMQRIIQNHNSDATQWFDKIMHYLYAHREKFPCLPNNDSRKPIAKKSGLYL